MLTRLTDHPTSRWWVVFAVVIVLPSLALSVISLRLIGRLARDEMASLMRDAESGPWYFETKINRALAARALHAARVIGREALADPRLRRDHLRDAGLDMFAVLEVHAPRSAAAPSMLFGGVADEYLALSDGKGGPAGFLRYRYTTAGMKAAIHEAYNDLRAPWNDDSVELFFGGPTSSLYDESVALHLDVRAVGGALWERQGRTAGLRAASAVGARGFSVEVAVPWQHLGVTPREGAALRFDLTNDDDDDGGLRDGQRTWSGHSRNWVDPSMFGVLRLGSAAAGAETREAVARPATSAAIRLDGRLSEEDWALSQRVEKTEGRTDNRVRFGALWTEDELLVGVDVEDGHVVDDHSREEQDWLLRVVSPDGTMLYESSPGGSDLFGTQERPGVRHVATTGVIKGSTLLFALRDLPMSQRVGRWKISAMALILAIDVLLGVGLWLVYSNTRHQMALVALKSDFVATVSHEFKAPLALLRASAETLCGGRVLEKDVRDRYATIIERETRRLAALVDNVLSVSRLEAGRRYQFAPTDLAAVVDAALSLYRARLEEEGFLLELRLPRDLPPVPADAGALQEALSNLIDNAMKYSGERRFCRIEAKDLGDAVAVSVTDAGSGVLLAEQERVFERFYRGRETGHATKGAGLGLSVAREILRAHGGDVSIASGAFSGSTFTLVVPKARRPA